MKTSIKNIILFAFIAAAFASCSTDGIEPIASANDVIERVDIKITGSTNQYIYDESIQSDANIDLVDFDFSGNPSDNFGFVVQLGPDRILKVMTSDNYNPDHWTLTGQSFDVFAAQDIDDKYRYAIIEVIDRTGSEIKTYTTNRISNDHPVLHTFTIQNYSNDRKEILCRLDNATLVEAANTNNSITLNGTFKGAITF